MCIRDSYKSAQRLAIIRIVLLVLVTVIATVFIVYLYITRRKKDYAIMRALGTTQKQSAFSLLLPLIVLGTTGIVFGTACGILYTVLTGNTLLIWTIPLCVVTELIFMPVSYTHLSLPKRFFTASISSRAVEGEQLIPETKR